jgi:predicted branched-subunit amino acid permease
MTNPRQALLAGVHSIVPILPGVIPFGLIAGAATVAVGLPAPSAIGMSLLIFAGMSQLATVELLAQSAPWIVIIATALVVNLRFMIYSAALGARVPPEWSLDFAVPLTLLALIPSTVRDRAALVTLGATAAAVWLFHALPLNLGVILSVAVGVGAGWLWKRRADPGARTPAPEINE